MEYALHNFYEFPGAIYIDAIDRNGTMRVGNNVNEYNIESQDSIFINDGN